MTSRLAFKPIHYKRYVDDTFLVFKNTNQIKFFLDYLNCKHPNIKFTCDIEVDKQISFLDVLITRHDGNFSTSVYRKSTFTGLGLNYLSFVPDLFKINSIRTLINRAYNVCSDLYSFHLDLVFLCDFFVKNAYPSFLFHKHLRYFLNEKFNPRPIVTTVGKQVMYIKLPYMGCLSFEVKKKLQNLLVESFPQLCFRFTFVNIFTLGSMLRAKSPVRSDLCSNVTYLFTCAHCNVRYLGSTSRWLRHRYMEHLGRSFRTGMPLAKPAYSAIREHCLNENHPFTYSNFEILTFAPNRLELLISESILIKRMKPELNNTTSAFQLLSID